MIEQSSITEIKWLIGVRRTALYEMISFLLFLFCYDYFFRNGDRMMDVYPHPCWVIVLLISVEYGTKEGILSAILSTLFLYLWNLPEQQVNQNLFAYQYQIAFRPFLWLSAAFVLGELRMHLERLNHHLRDELKDAETQRDTIARAYQTMKSIKEDQETILASQQKTFVGIYKTFQALETLNPGQIILNLDEVIKSTMNPKKFSVFSMGENGFEVLTSRGWAEKDLFLRRIPATHPLCKELIRKQDLICIVNRDDQKAFLGEGMIASPLIDQDSGDIIGMVKIEEIDFLDLNFSNLETFKVLCQLIGMAYANAKKYKSMAGSSIYDESQEIYSHNFFNILSPFLESLFSKLEVPFPVIEVKSEKKEKGIDLQRIEVDLLKEMRELSFQPSLLFKGKRKSGEWLILSPFSDEVNLKGWIMKLNKMHPTLSFSVKENQQSQGVS